MNLMPGLMGVGILVLALGACGSNVETDGEGASSEDGGSGGTGGSSLNGGADNEGGDGEGGVAEAGGPSVGGQQQGGESQGGDSQGGSGEGGAAPVCAAMNEIVLSNPTFVEAGGNSDWSAGETASLRVTMTNESAEDNFYYPGVEISADIEGFVSSGNTLFGIFGSESTEIDFSVQAPEGIATGTSFTLTIQVTSLNEECPGLDSVELQLILN